MSIEVTQIPNVHYGSNTYLLEDSIIKNFCCLIDIGNAQSVFDCLKPKQKVTQLFITHAHLDHIEGINDLIKRFPECEIYVSLFTKRALSDSKLNLSLYQNKPIEFKSDNIHVVEDGEQINILSKDVLCIMETPGHNKGALSFRIGNGIFTGDSLIPETKVVTKLKSGNKQEAKRSIHSILNNLKDDEWIYPGHGSYVLKSSINQCKLF